MATSKPRPAAQTAAESTIAAPADPGPPPRFPAPPQVMGAGFYDGLRQLFDMGRQAAPIPAVREAVQGFSTLRLGPEVAAYKAEILEWLDAMEAYQGAQP